MKHIINISKAAFPAVLLFGFAINASAQRRGGGGGGERQSPEARAESRPQQQSSPQGQERHATIRTQPAQQSFPRNENTGISQSNNPRQGSYPIRQTRPNAPTRPDKTQTFPAQQQTQRVETQTARVNNNSNRDINQRRQDDNNFRRVNNNDNRGNVYNNARYNNGRGYEYNRYDRRPITVNRYYYSGAYHPRPYYYRPFSEPHWGIRISILPRNYYSFYLGSYNYYYDRGLFYRPYDGYYETIEPPLGAFVPILPPGAVPTVINNMTYYENNGTYYQRTFNAPQPYEVVGVNGYLKTDLPPAPDGDDIISDESINPSLSAPSSMNELPSNFKTVTLNSITYYVSPSGEYYTKNIDANGRVTYTVAALENR